MGAPEKLADMMKRLARMIPGIGTYQDREARRDTDKRFRVWLADQMDEERRRIRPAKEGEGRLGRLENLDDLDRLERTMQKVADSIRFASYGYGGLFDHVRIDDEKLSEMYRYDLALADELEVIRNGLNGLASEVSPDAIQKIRDAVDLLDQKMRERSAISQRVHEKG